MRRRRSLTTRVALAAGLALSSAACTGAIDEEMAEPLCGGALLPAAPAIVDPLVGRIDVVPAAMVIETTAFADDDGDPQTGTDVEIWHVLGGEPDERVWSAHVTDPTKFTRVTLADGSYQGSAAGGGLLPWNDHVVRARHLSAGPDGCVQVGPWSAYRRFRTDDGSAALFDDSTIHDFYLEIPPDSYAAIDAEAVPPDCVTWERSYHAGNLRFGDQLFEQVGIKAKGGCGSARNLSGKTAFKVNLELEDPSVATCPADRRLLGEKHLTLNNTVQDPSASHERLGYALYRAMGVPAPRTAPARVFVNGQLYGTYLHVETVDRRFLSRWFGSNDGMLYEGAYFCDLELASIADDDSGCLNREFRPDTCSSDVADSGEGDPLDYSPVRDLITALDALPEGGFYPAVTEVVDFDTFLSMWAVEALFGHWDGYVYEVVNNYRVYHDPVSGLWTILPSGLDQTFGTDTDPWAVHGRLATRCLAEPACEARFVERLQQAVQVFEQLDLAGRTAAIRDQMSPFFAAGADREISPDAFNGAIDATIGFIGGRPARIREYLAAHGH
jgi:CotH protein